MTDMPYHQLSNHEVRLCCRYERYERLRTFSFLYCDAYLSNFHSYVKIAARWMAWGFDKLVLWIWKAKGLGVLLWSSRDICHLIDTLVMSS